MPSSSDSLYFFRYATVWLGAGVLTTTVLYVLIMTGETRYDLPPTFFVDELLRLSVLGFVLSTPYVLPLLTAYHGTMVKQAGVYRNIILAGIVGFIAGLVTPIFFCARGGCDLGVQLFPEFLPIHYLVGIVVLLILVSFTNKIRNGV